MVRLFITPVTVFTFVSVGKYYCEYLRFALYTPCPREREGRVVLAPLDMDAPFSTPLSVIEKQEEQTKSDLFPRDTVLN